MARARVCRPPPAIPNMHLPFPPSLSFMTLEAFRTPSPTRPFCGWETEAWRHISTCVCKGGCHSESVAELVSSSALSSLASFGGFRSGLLPPGGRHGTLQALPCSPSLGFPGACEVPPG